LGDEIQWGFFFEDQADKQQRDVLQMIFTGKAGGFIAEFAKPVVEMRATE
jgi:hypothetical protein